MKVLGNRAVLVTSSGPYAKICESKFKGTTDVTLHHLHIVHIVLLYFYELVPSQITSAIRLFYCVN